MKEVIITYSKKIDKEIEPIEAEHLWYDNLKQEMKVFKCSYLSFEYQKDKYIEKMSSEERQLKGVTSVYRLLPVPCYKEKEKVIFSNDKDEIIKYIRQFDNVFVNYVRDNELSVDVPESDVSDFTIELDNHRIEYEIV